MTGEYPEPSPLASLIADYYELDDFRNNIGNEAIVDSMGNIAGKIRREILNYPVTTFDDLKEKIYFACHHIAHLKRGATPPETTCDDEYGYWVLARDARTLADQQIPQLKAA